jgi:SET domain-containing protein
MFSWMNPNLEVRNTKKYGKGVFTKEDIKKDSTLAFFGGYIMSLQEESLLDKSIRDSAHQIDDNLVIGIKNVKEIQDVDFFNHSCEPNAGFRGQICLVSMKNIKKGEEVTFDYAMVLGGDEPYELNCQCSNSTCRGKITNTDWKNLKLQKEYEGYFQWYIQDKIIKNKLN